MKLKTISTILIMVIALAVISCNANKYADIPKPAGNETSLNIANAGTDTLKFYVNGTLQNLNSYIYPGGASGYITIPDSVQSLNFKKAANKSNYNSNYLFSTPLRLNIPDSTSHTLFVAGETTDKCFLVKDTTASASGGALIRFVHASPNVPATDVSVGDSVSFKNRSFKSVSGYVPISAGTKKLVVKQAGSSTSLLNNIAITVTPGYTYTLYLKGKVNGTGNSAIGFGLLAR